MHTPVFADEVVAGLGIKKSGLYIDATAGEGGHIEKIRRLGPQVLGIDRDSEQIQALTAKFMRDKQVKIVEGRFSQLEEIAKAHGFYPSDGILFDLGLSMSQIALSKRGFSIKHDEEILDMRMSTLDPYRACDFLAQSSQTELAILFAKYAEEPYSADIARLIVTRRKKNPIITVGDLKIIVVEATGAASTRSLRRVFQALRIAVNNEFEEIRQGLTQAARVVAFGGRICLITFHSLEDRIVKQEAKKLGLQEIVKKIPKGNQQRQYEKSAKLRVFLRNKI